MDQSSFNLTPQEAVQVLLARHAFSVRVKAAAGLADMLPSSDTVSQFAQNVMTPPAGEAGGGYRALRGGLAGAGIGALGGAGSALLGGKKKRMLHRALTGAMIGGGLGAAVPGAMAAGNAALANPPSVAKNEAAKAEALAAADAFQKKPVLERAGDAAGSQRTSLTYTDNKQPGNAALAMAPLGGRMAIQAAGGALAGTAMDHMHMKLAPPRAAGPHGPAPQLQHRLARGVQHGGTPSSRYAILSALAAGSEPLWEPYAIEAWKKLRGTGK